MQSNVSYNLPTLAGSATAVSITTSEAAVLTISDLKYPMKSQLTLYFDVDLSGGTITSVKFRLYFSTTNASETWYPVPVRNLSTGELVDLPIIIDSTSYAYATNKYRAVYDIPMSSAAALQVTAIGVGSSTATLNTIAAMVRDN